MFLTPRSAASIKTIVPFFLVISNASSFLMQSRTISFYEQLDAGPETTAVIAYDA